jgi:hypothetical protein
MLKLKVFSASKGIRASQYQLTRINSKNESLWLLFFEALFPSRRALFMTD